MAGAAITAGQMAVFSHELTGDITKIGAGADALTKGAIDKFLKVVAGTGDAAPTTGQIIAAAATLKSELGASKAYYDVISTLGDEMKRLIGDAVK